MFCSKCGKEIFDEAVVCPNCGCMVKDFSQIKNRDNTENQKINEYGEKQGLAIAALACGFLIPIVGLILGIIGTVKYKTEKYKTMCIGAIVLSVVVWIISVLVISTMY